MITNNTIDYQEFIGKKHIRSDATGFDYYPSLIPEKTKDWQNVVIRWACRRGKAALFLDTGLGKTLCQLSWAKQVNHHTGGNILILCPLAVADQTRREGIKFGVSAKVCRKMEDVEPGITITNYEMLEHFDASKFTGVVLDESAILKNYTGVRKREIIEAFQSTPFKLACSATPAPNDHLELGNHAEFLNVMPSNEMVSRWFINDTMKSGGYRLKGHAAKDFWNWVATWAVSIQKPSDIGYDDAGYILPKLNTLEIEVDVDVTEDAGDMLFRDTSINATTMHQELRRTATARAEKVGEIVGQSDGTPFLVWCHTDYEADELCRVLPDAMEVRGSDSVEKKERVALAFSAGEIKCLISKPKIFGAGLNFQQCHNMAFVGLSFSYESLYQSIRRCWRFGQQHEVNAYIVRASTEGVILKTIKEKERLHRQMQSEMVSAMRGEMLEQIGERLKLNTETGTAKLNLPKWIKK